MGYLFILLSVAVMALPLFIAAGAWSRTAKLNRRLEKLEHAVDRLLLRLPPTAPAPDAAGPATAAPQPPPTQPDAPVAPASAAKTPAPAQKDSSADTPRIPPTPAVPSVPAPPAPPPPSNVAAEPARGLEERLGAQWTVWIGGIALALGGIFLVRYSIEAGLIGPAVRVFLGAVLAAALVGGGENLRRNDMTLSIGHIPSAHIPGSLTAAGTVVAFGTIYAAHALYGFIGPTLAFVLLGATGVATMLAAALHGPWLAGLGLVGAMATPFLVESPSPNPWPVVLYLAVVAASAYALSRTRHWLWLAIATLAGAILWGLAFVGLDTQYAWPLVLPASAHVLLQMALAALAFAVEPHAATRDRDAQPDRVATTALFVIAALAGVVAVLLNVSQLVVLAGMSALILATTVWRAPAAAPALLASGLITSLALLIWPSLPSGMTPTDTAPYAEHVLRLPARVTSFLLLAAALSLPPAVAATYRLWSGALLPRATAAWLSAGAVLLPLFALIVTYLRLTQFEASIPFALIALGGAFVFALVAGRFQAADENYDSPAYATATGVFAVAAIAALALALTMSLSRGYLTVAFALTAFGAAYVSDARNIPLLRGAVTALGLIVLARCVWDPRIAGDDVGTWPIFNWLLFGYGVPMLSFYGAARILERKGNDRPQHIAEALALLFAGLLAFFQIRHLTNDGNILAQGSEHVEVGLMALVAMGLSYVTAQMNMKKASPVLNVGATVYGALALVASAVGLAVAANPVFTGDAVNGTPLFGSLTLGYLLPGIAAFVLARHLRGLRPAWFTRTAGVVGVGLVFLFVTLAIRQGFHGADIYIGRGSSNAEQWAYSVGWLALGVAFLAYGLVRHSLEARIASAVLIVLTTLKVMFYDLAGIDGVWRALSFLILGAVLTGIGLVYQRYVFRPGNSSGGQPERTDGEPG